MKIIVFLALVGLVAAQQGRPRTAASDPAQITILRQEQENNGDGTYSFAYETSDGTSAQEKGYLKPAPPGSEYESIQVQEGNYKFYSPEGEEFKLDYLADENGFQPQAAHLPTSPPIPAEIAKMLEIVYNNAQQQRAAASFQQPQHQQAPRPRPRPRF
jgi:hypothetical protein